MRPRFVALLLCAACLIGVRSASAQEQGSLGITMGYPASVGFLWHVAERVALRPEVSFVHNSSETDSSAPFGVDTETDGNAFAVGVSALFYVHKWDATRTYVTPRYAYTRANTSVEGALAPLMFESTNTGHSVGVSFGAQHLLGEHFALFGELGLVYERARTEFSTTVGTGNSIGTRSGVGVVVYF